MTGKLSRRRALGAVAGSLVLGGCTAILDRERTVRTRDGLVESLESAERGETITVDRDAQIDLSGVWKVTVPEGVTLRGSRGDAGAVGALLYAPEGDEGPEDEQYNQKFQLAPGARFTGFRLRGHHHEYVNPVTEYDGNYYAHRGGGVRAGTNAEVDNNVISGWPHAAVVAERNAHVHHNTIHHNTWEGLGYGVIVPEGDHMPLIEYNDFDYNRHSVTGSGGPDVGYVVRENVFGKRWVGSQVDMHGSEGMSGVAGERMVIQRNTFQATRAVEAKTRDPGGEYPAVHVRGTPMDGVWVEKNWFLHEDREGAYQQTDGPNRVSFANNHYGRRPPPRPTIGAARSLPGVA